MCRKVFLSIFLVVILISLSVGCSKNDNDPNKTIDETKIENQLNKWARAFETGDRNNFKESMIADNILVVLESDGGSEERVFETVDDFIEVITDGNWTYESSEIEFSNISISNNSGKAYGKWIRIDDFIKYTFPIEFNLEKINDNWFISVIHFGEESEEYMGNEYEDFEEGRHNAYVSFVAGGKKYVFHDHYGGTTEKTVYDNEHFSLYADNYILGNNFSIVFAAGASEFSIGAVTQVSLVLNKKSYYDYSLNVEFTDKDKSLADGLLQGVFSGILAKGEEEIKIEDGFFYVKHEFNIPELTINKPEDNKEVSGEVIISITVDDESDIDFISVNLSNDSGDVYFDDINGTDNWSFTFNSTEFNDGNCSLLVVAQDIYGNTISKEINFIIKNK